MRYLTSILLIIFFFSNGYCQDSIRYRIIFIGDAGEMNPTQQLSLKHAANHIIQGKTSVVYLGDNVYPRGMGLPGSSEEAQTQQILQSQYQPMRQQGAPVYFVPGNHDWDKSGPKGFDKIQAQSNYIQSLGDSLLQLLPANGCPDPIEINLTDSLTIIAWDSEWWLYPFDKENTNGDCDCNTKADVLLRLNELFYKNRHKVILLASHHPFQSNGIHGGKFTLKDHIFPLTNVKENLYIPLPIIGSLYPFLRSTFPNPEDLNHPLYKDMIKRVDGVFKGFPNVVHVAGHEHGLQFIKGKQVQVVSGAGAKHTNVGKRKGSLFADATQGYVTADLLAGNTLRFTYYIYTNDTIQQAYTYAQKYTAVTDAAMVETKDLAGDTITVKIHPIYNRPGKLRRSLFGENYREEWASPVTLPVIHISKVAGGLTPTQTGGGMQSKSLRLKDPTGKEWVIRSVEKSVGKLMPPTLQDSFVKDWLDDVTSAQHPFGALIVPPIADAVKVPHSNPIVGVLSPDKNLGIYNNQFSKLVVLLEEREPLGESDNSEKMKKNLQKDNDNTIDAKEMQRARMLDALLADWDRHEDQWRWFDDGKKNKHYIAVPRDRDQVLHLRQGLLPNVAAREYILPTLRNFDAGIRHPEWLLFKTRFVNAYPEMQFSKEEWDKQSQEFTKAVTDSVLEEGLRRLPKPSYDIRHDVLKKTLTARRDRLPAAMDQYYRFTQKIVDIATSDKNELVEINGAENGGLTVRIRKINKEGEIKDDLMNKTYDPALTKEIRIYIRNGADSVVVNNQTSNIKLRIIGGKGEKNYNVVASKNNIQLYDRDNGSHYEGDSSRLNKHIGNDTMTTYYAPVNLYNITMPLVTAGLNIDDGFILGGGFKLIKQEGFHKFPYASMHQLMASHSFSTQAFRIKYNSEWIHTFGKADLMLQAFIKAPDNTINFFGTGNETVYNKTGNFKRFYRARFNTYQLDPALRWRNEKGTSISIGPSLYYYRFDKDDTTKRYINQGGKIGSYDSLTYAREKVHLGVAVQYTSDKRNNKILTQWGTFVNIRLQAYKGMGNYAQSFAQLIPEVALYKSLNRKSTIILAERFGGTISLGNPAFYQSAFIGGQENLLGYKQFRFAGQHSFYNNLELRIKLADVANYILPGQLGITGFWDIGRVWEKHDNSGKWHNGNGAGIYFAPASMLVVSFVAGHSTEGWYPYFTMGFRF